MSYVPPHKRSGFKSKFDENDTFEEYKKTHVKQNRSSPQQQDPRGHRGGGGGGRGRGGGGGGYQNQSNRHYDPHYGHQDSPNQDYNNRHGNSMQNNSGYGHYNNQMNNNYGNNQNDNNNYNGRFGGGGRDNGRGNSNYRNNNDYNNNERGNDRRGPQFRDQPRQNNNRFARGFNGGPEKNRINFHEIGENYHLNSFSNVKLLTTKKPNLLVIGISGATHSGKTTLSENIKKYFIYSQNQWNKQQKQTQFENERKDNNNNNNNSTQDDKECKDENNTHNTTEYKEIRLNIRIFRQEDHFDKETIDDNLGRNFDDPRSVNHDKFYLDICSYFPNVIETSNNKSLYHIWICEGYMLYYEKRVSDMCDLKFWLTIDKEECLKRCLVNTRSKEKAKEYFESKQWPGFLNYKKKLLENNKNLKNENENIFNSLVICDSVKDNETGMLKIVLKTVLKQCNQWNKEADVVTIETNDDDDDEDDDTAATVAAVAAPATSTTTSANENETETEVSGAQVKEAPIEEPTMQQFIDGDVINNVNEDTTSGNDNDVNEDGADNDSETQDID